MDMICFTFIFVDLSVVDDRESWILMSSRSLNAASVLPRIYFAPDTGRIMGQSYQLVS